jgi:hypothetical protein
MINKYHEGEKVRWVNQMVNAVWQLWIFVDSEIMWRHADEGDKLWIVSMNL